MDEDRSKKMKSIRNDFSIRSDDYDREIVITVPNYHQMLDSAVGSLPFDDDEPIRVIDLGTGTGSMAARVLLRFPRCRLTCVDMTREMLDKAKARLGDRSDVTYVERDFYELEMSEGNDAVVSSLALHHLITDDDKRNFYGKVLRSLHPGGVFVNADAVHSTDGWVEDLYRRRWIEFMRSNLSEGAVQTVLERHKREDSLPVLMDQLRWLNEVGFSKVDIIWKDHMGAVVWAMR